MVDACGDLNSRQAHILSECVAQAFGGNIFAQWHNVLPVGILFQGTFSQGERTTLTGSNAPNPLSRHGARAGERSFSHTLLQKDEGGKGADPRVSRRVQ